MVSFSLTWLEHGVLFTAPFIHHREESSGLPRGESSMRQASLLPSTTVLHSSSSTLPPWPALCMWLLGFAG